MNNVLHIIGGITGYEQYLQSTYTVNLDTGKTKSYNIHDPNGIAYTRGVPIFKKFIPRYFHVGKNKIKLKSFVVQEEGIYIFGGKNEKGKVKNKMVILRLDENYQPLEWKTPEVKGSAPAARFHHSMSLYLPLTSLLIYGGRNDRTGEVFSDFWLFSLRTMEYF